MKSLILASLLFVIPLFAEETNTITFTITTTVTLKQVTPSLIISSNVVSSLVITNNDLSPKAKLLSEIRKMEEKIYELTNGVPTSYASSPSQTSTNMINRLEEIWAKYDKAVSNLNVKRLEFKQTP